MLSHLDKPTKFFNLFLWHIMILNSYQQKYTLQYHEREIEMRLTSRNTHHDTYTHSWGQILGLCVVFCTFGFKHIGKWQNSVTFHEYLSVLFIRKTSKTTRTSYDILKIVPRFHGNVGDANLNTVQSVTIPSPIYSNCKIYHIVIYSSLQRSARHRTSAL